MVEQDIGRYWKQIIDSVSDGLMLVDPKGNIVMVNKAMEDLTGYGAEKLIGSTCRVLRCDACDPVRAGGKGAWCGLFKMKRLSNKRCLFMRKDGTFVSAIKKARILEDHSSRVIGAVETFVDISEVDKRDEKIKELSRLQEPDIGFQGIVGKSRSMQKIFHIIDRAAQSDVPVLIYGESGTGKELVAQAVHEVGRRREGPFIQFNCAALNESLLESELFGHVKGAFTGAYRHRMGRFESAHGGDIFLDEIGDVPLATQTKLLRVLETKQFERVGDHRSITVDVRVICATNRDLPRMVAQEKFRKDLFFRINVIPIHLPPLRERREDIPLLVSNFIERLCAKSKKHITGVTPEVMKYLMEYEWPGNVRELKSMLEYGFVIAEQGLMGFDHLPERRWTGTMEAPPLAPADAAGNAFSGKDQRTMLIEALRVAGGNKTEAAKILGINRMTVWNRMKKYGIDLEEVLKEP